MRFYSFVAAAALASASLAAYADTITQTFAIPFQTSHDGYTNYEGSLALTPFNPADGTFNSATLSLYGSYTVDSATKISAGAQFGNLSVLTMPEVGGPGTYQISLSETESDAFDLQRLETHQSIYADISGGDLTTADVTAAVTYNYTPAVTPVAATPEPSSFALLGTGVLGALGVARKRFV